jgi:predicted acyltransferase
VIVHFFKLRGAFVVSFVILTGYWLLCYAMNPADPYGLHGWFGTKVDLAILGDKHMYHGEEVVFDPEGLMNTFGSIVQVIFGYMVGNYIINKGKTAEMLNGLFVAGCVMIFTGFIWDMVFPINKKIWTSSYTVYTTGLALLVIALMIYLLDFKNKKGAWSRFFDVFGKNALFIFAMSNIVVKLLALARIHTMLPNEKTGLMEPAVLGIKEYFYFKAAVPLFSDLRNASLLVAICFIMLMWFLAWLLDRKKIYIKV